MNKEGASRGVPKQLQRRLAISYAPALEWNGMPATDQASADPCLDRRFGFGCAALWESFAAGGASEQPAAGATQPTGRLQCTA